VTNEITAEDRQTVSMFVAFQEVRIPRTPDAMNKLVEDIAAPLLHMLFEHPDHTKKRELAELGHVMTDEDLAKMKEGIETVRSRSRQQRLLGSTR